MLIKQYVIFPLKVSLKGFFFILVKLTTVFVVIVFIAFAFWSDEEGSQELSLSCYVFWALNTSSSITNEGQSYWSIDNLHLSFSGTYLQEKISVYKNRPKYSFHPFLMTKRNLKTKYGNSRDDSQVSFKPSRTTLKQGHISNNTNKKIMANLQ